MKILVTGGCGFAGSNFIRYTIKNHPEDEVICFDKNECGLSLEEVKDNENFKYVQGDICDKEAVYSVFENEKPNVVVNYAKEHARSREYAKYFEVNVVGPAVLLDACAVYGIDHFHQISSAEVYGLLPLGREMFYSEKSVLRPVEQLSAAKSAADLLALSYYDTFQVPVTISRSVNLYGPYQRDEKQIPAQIIKALNDEELPIYGSGADVRDWLYIDDHSHAVDLIIRKGTPGEIYNVGSHNEIRSIYIARIILNELNKPESLIAYKENRRGKERRNAVDYTKIEKELGWQPQEEFPQGLKKTIQWFVDKENKGKK